MSALGTIPRLLAILSRPERLAVGLMSGTSVDGIDAALVQIDEREAKTRAEVVAFASFPFPASVRRSLFDLFRPETARVDELCRIDFVLGELFAEAVLRLLDGCGVPPAEVDLVGTAGQTIWHAPLPVELDLGDEGADWLSRPIATGATLAIGQSAVIAERTGIITIGDLRVRDVAAGGHGAPLVAYADWSLLRHETLGRCVQNIGGIANVTWLPAGGGLEDVVAFDTGPGNMVIDAMVSLMTDGRASYDVDGQLAARGQVNEALLGRWLADPWFALPPPKTTGREQYGVQFATEAIATAPGLPPEDLIATATALTAHTIADAYRHHVAPLGRIDEVVIGGGGSRNPTLMAHLARLMPDSRVLRHEDFGIDSQAKEALAIAIIANDALAGLATNVTGATGGRPTVLGKISL